MAEDYHCVDSGIVSDDSSSPRHSVAVHTDEPSQYMSCPNALVGVGSASQNPEARQVAAILVCCATLGARNVMLSKSQDEQVLSLEEQAARLQEETHHVTVSPTQEMESVHPEKETQNETISLSKGMESIHLEGVVLGSCDLTMQGNSYVPTATMPENVLEDTLTDLSHKSPEVNYEKVITQTIRLYCVVVEEV